MSELIAAIPLSLLLVFSTGPVFFVIVETSITKGAKQAFCVDIGAVIADIIFILIALFSAQSLRNSLVENSRWFIVGGIVLCAFSLFSMLSLKRQKKNSCISGREATKRKLPLLYSQRFCAEHYQYQHIFVLGWPGCFRRRTLVFCICLVDLFTF